MTNVLSIEVHNEETNHKSSDNNWDMIEMFELATATNHKTGEEEKAKESFN